MNTLKPLLAAATTVIAWLAVNAGASALACSVSGNGLPYPSISAALASGASFISFTGTCTESLFIVRDNVVINGAGPSMSTIGGEVFIGAATGVRLNNLAITGLPLSDPANSGIAVSLFNNAQASISGCTIDTQEEGLFAGRNSSARLTNDTISSSADTALEAGDNSVVLLFTGNTVTLDGNQPNASATVTVARNSVVRMGGGNTIMVSPPGVGTGTGTGTTLAVSIFENSTLRQDNSSGFGGVSPPHGSDTIQGDIMLFRHGVADIRAAQLSGNVTLNTQSILTLGDRGFGAGQVTINGNTTANGNSIVEFASTAPTVNGSIACLDTLSQLTSPGPLNVTIQPVGTGCITGNQNSQTAGNLDSQ